MTSPAIALLIAATAAGQVIYSTSGGSINGKELQEQRATYQKLWDADLVVRFADLPQSGSVPEHRVPYSGHDYPDKTGGTLGAMAKYDKAFYRGQSRAYQAEREDLDFHMTVKTEGPPRTVRRGLFGRVISSSGGSSVVPTWYGHCNGWTAASIRHAEPQKSVTRNGVVLTPTDIKGMLAEMYMYSRTQSLGGEDKDVINPAMLHISVSNWLGRKSHPIAMETQPGDPVINFPVYSYKTTTAKLSPNRYDVKNWFTYTLHLPKEYDKGPKSNRQLYLHYVLDLDAQGNIVGGQYQRDSWRVDMLWAPMQIVSAGQEGNRSGNRHLDVNEVLAIWRESVDEETLKKWVNIDPSEEELKLIRTEVAKVPVTEEKTEEKKGEPTTTPEAAPATTAPTTTSPPAATNPPAANPPATEPPVASP